MSTTTYKNVICFAKLFFKNFLQHSSFVSFEALLNDLNILNKAFNQKKVGCSFLFLNSLSKQKVDSVFEEIIFFLKVNQFFLLYFKFLWHQNKLNYSLAIIKELKRLVLVEIGQEECSLFFSHKISEELIEAYKNEISTIFQKQPLFNVQIKPDLCLGFRVLSNHFMIEKRFIKNLSKLITPLKI